MKRIKKRLRADAYVEGILNHHKVVFSQAITLVESNLEEDAVLAQEVLERILPHTGNSIRLGITGVPGVGKSTFIEALGKHITRLSKKLAVLAIDPSSQRSGGSIMGDKTRMEMLSIDPLAYIRPSPAQGSLGGVARKTRETMLICEAAGFEVIMVETVGVGQSETAVHSMVDFFLLLMLAGAGDELQGIKKGIMEMADVIAITKADGENSQKARVAKTEYENALHLFPPSTTGWNPAVLTCSALRQHGIAEIWERVQRYRQYMQQGGFFQEKRREQNLHWMHESIRQSLKERFYHHPTIQAKLSEIEEMVQEGKMPALKGAMTLLRAFGSF